MNTHILGTLGETLATKYLKKQGYKILQTNYKNTIGEIDIIAKDKDIFVFVEVKTRSSKRYGLPREAITPYKQQKIKNIAMVYLKFNKLLDQKVRFDCIEILDDKIEHIKNCF